MKLAVKIVLIVVALVAVVAIAAIGWAAYSAHNDLELARETCRDEITSQAKYESGVSFIDGTEDESETVSENGLINYKVTGEVDLLNGFGVPVRHTYWCHVGARNGEVGNPESTIDRK